MYSIWVCSHPHISLAHWCTTHSLLTAKMASLNGLELSDLSPTNREIAGAVGLGSRKEASFTPLVLLWVPLLQSPPTSERGVLHNDRQL